MGFFRGLDADKYDRQYSDAYLYKRLGDYLQSQKKRIAIISFMGVLSSLALAAIPIFTSYGVGLLEESGDFSIVWLLVAGLGVSAITQYFVNWTRRRLTSRLVADVMADLRKDAFSSAVERDMAFYDRNKSGKIISRITSDTEELGTVLTVVSDIVSQLIQVFILLAYLFFQNVMLTLLLLVFMPILMVAFTILRKLARRATRQGSRAMGAVNDNIQESVTGISVAKNFRQEASIYEEFTKVNDQSYRINLRRGFVLATTFPVLNIIAGFAIGSILYAGAVAITSDLISISIWYLYIQSVDRFWFPFINIAAFINQFQQALSSAERIFALIDTENTLQQIDDRPVESLEGHVELKNVLFEYETDHPILEDFSLDIKPGESVAFVGHTGAGKSTITKILTRFYEFQGGDVLIDGQDIRTFDLHSYRSLLGLVPQTPFLFSGSILDNVRYGRPSATDEEIETLAHSIGEGEWLETVPDGLHTDVGERGSQLSMGQRQLVALLRVLVQKPAIFILDEATASIDPFTETQIQEALDLILQQSTSILIAHRLSTVRSADRIIVIKEGKIIEEGNHETLLKKEGHYAELYNTYFRHQSLSYIEDARSLLDGQPAK